MTKACGLYRVRRGKMGTMAVAETQPEIDVVEMLATALAARRGAGRAQLIGIAGPQGSGKSTLLIDTLLVDHDPDRRARTALAIGQLRVRARLPQLRRLLTDGDTLIAANAAYALGVAKDTLAVAALARAIGGAPDPVAREAAWAATR